MDDLSLLKSFFAKMWSVLDTSITLPWIGTTSILKMDIYLAVLALLVYFVNRSIGGSGE